MDSVNRASVLPPRTVKRDNIALRFPCSLVLLLQRFVTTLAAPPSTASTGRSIRAGCHTRCSRSCSRGTSSCSALVVVPVVVGVVVVCVWARRGWNRGSALVTACGPRAARSSMLNYHVRCIVRTGICTSTPIAIVYSRACTCTHVACIRVCIYMKSGRIYIYDHEY